MEEELYLKIYVTGQLSFADLTDRIATILAAKREVRTIATGSLVVDVFEQGKAASPSALSEFLSWPWYLEVEAASPDIAREDFVAAVKKLIEGLQRAGLRTVVSGDLEKEF
jgi:hypothetical protein